MTNYTRFLLGFGKIGCIGFGGGSALIPIIEEEIIEKQQLDTKENFDKDVIVASITPGALPVELAASLGRRNFGYKGMIFGPVMIALPGTLMAILLLTILSMARQQVLSQIELASIGVNALIICLLCNYIIHMLNECKKESLSRLKKAIFIMLAVLFLTGGKNVCVVFGIDWVPVFSVSTFHLLLAAFFCIFYSRNNYSLKNVMIMSSLSTIYLLSYGKADLIDNIFITRMTEIGMLALSIWGITRDIGKGQKAYHLEKSAMQKDIRTWLFFLVLCLLPAFVMQTGALKFFGNSVLSAMMSFGGGDAYLTIADGLFVQNGMVTETQYYGQIISVVNLLPGSILCKTLSCIGYYTGLNLSGKVVSGLLLAMLGFACSIATSCAIFSLVYYLYDSLIALRAFRMISRWIRPIIAGLLLNIILELYNQSIKISTDLNINIIWTMCGILMLCLADFLFMKRFCKNVFIALAFNLMAVYAIHTYI